MQFGATLLIERLGHRGEGIATHGQSTVYVPHALPGETIRAGIDGKRGVLTEVLEASPERIDAICQYYGTCGGCAVQIYAPDAYAKWKRSIVTEALSRAQIAVPVDDLVPAHGHGRRRVTLHARIDQNAPPGHKAATGFMRARSHDIIEIDQCPVLSRGLDHAPEIARCIAETLGELGKPLDIVLTETQSGIDADIRGAGALPAELRLALSALAERLDLARIANHGDIIIVRHMPVLSIGQTQLTPPPGAFLQATLAAEDTLARLVAEAAGSAGAIADLFSGVGTFSLRLAERAIVSAVESDAAALQALDRAARFASGLKKITVHERDLFRRPLRPEELAAFDCVIFDPPRAGAQAQAMELAQSAVPCVIAVSCNAQTFSADAKTLTGGGYTLTRVTPVDQFLYSPHVEIVGVFTRAAKKKNRRRLLG